MDAKTTFLQCDIEEELCMKHLEGIAILVKEYLVCKLKSLDGLKQASRQRYKMFDDFMFSPRFRGSQCRSLPLPKRRSRLQAHH